MTMILPRKFNKKTITAILFLLFCFTCAIYGQDENQLKINYWTLSNSTDEQIRIDTAKELLVNPAAEARKILLDVLGSANNNGTANSVCKALNEFRSTSYLIINKQDFISPLMKLIKEQNVETARLAAQATLIFSFKELKAPLEQIIKNPESSDVVKKNAIYAFQIRPDKETVIELIELLESDDVVISSVAGQSLQEWLPIGNDKQQWNKIKSDIEKGKIDIVREKVLTEQDKIHSLKEDVVKWQKKYITSLDNIYAAMSEDSAKAKFVAENLAFEQETVKLWAIEKINMWQKSGKLLPIDTIQKPLVALISDNVPEVRIAAVKLLGMLTNINSAEALFDQLNKETFPDVKTEIIVSLGHVCNFALSPGSDMNINPEIRVETLKATVAFFKDTKPIISAEVIRNLLLQNGLEAYEVKPYFQYIADNYKKTQDEQVKIGLLDEMQRLCGSDSFYKEVAGDVFRDIFTAAIEDKNSLVAAPAVSGLLRIDPAGSFDLLKSKNFTGHESSKIRSELITVAGQIGTAKDLEWLDALTDKADTDEEKQKAAEAMMNIFQYCKTDSLIVWGQKLTARAKAKNDDVLLGKARTLFETAEKKAEAQQDQKTLDRLRHILADSYAEAALYAPAAKYYGILLQNADPNEKEDLTAKLLDVNVRGGQAESAKQLLNNILLSSDIGADKKVCIVLDTYFSQTNDKDRAFRIFRAISAIELSGKYPLWSKQLVKWRDMIIANASTPGPNTIIADSNSRKTK